jgi:tetratricopeptide (TPR) repeat protein
MSQSTIRADQKGGSVAKDSDAEGFALGGGGASATALGLAGASREQADAFLLEQTRLARAQVARIEAQDDHLAEEQRLELSHLRIRRLSDYAKIALELAAGLLLIVVVAALGVMAWAASRDHDLVVDAFSVPPDMAARGETGLVVASQLLDQFGRLQAGTQPTAQTEDVYRLNVGENVRIAIPQTGISVGDLDQLLRSWLGHEVHVGGEIVHSPDGPVLTVRYAGNASVEVKGTEADFDGLMKQGAEGLYSIAQPLRYSDYLVTQGRLADSLTILKRLAVTGSPIERARALTSWAEGVDFAGRGREALSIVEEALRLAPSASFAWAVDSDAQCELGHDEAAHAAETRMVATAPQTWSRAQLVGSQLAYLPYFIAQRRDGHAGNFAAAARDWNQMSATSGSGLANTDAELQLTEFAPQRAAAHDLAGARRAVTENAGIPSDAATHVAYANAVIAFYAGDWRAVVENATLLEADPNLYLRAWQEVQVRPLRAVAMARLGDLAGAEALIAPTPLDCDLCVRARGQVAALKGDWRAADAWFATVAARSPSIPFAYTDWGEALLAKGDLDGAIDKFRRANAISPTFADPLKGWGDALARQGRWSEALAKYSEGLNNAPTWQALRDARDAAARRHG